MTVTLSREAILALDMHRLAELDELIIKTSLNYIKVKSETEKKLIKLAKEREALRLLVSQ